MNDLTALHLLIYALAVARVTGLITADSLTEPVRDKIIARLDPAPGSAGAAVATLITCPWCAGMWVSLAAGPMVWYWGDSPFMLVSAVVLAFSQFTGMVSDLGR
jgi:fatty acid desaturase